MLKGASDVSVAPGRLFDSDAPDGFRYRNDFLSRDEEAVLAGEIARLEFSTFEMRGAVARRRVVSFGKSYDAGRAITPAIPAFLMPLREMVAAWADVEAHAFVMALIKYPRSPRAAIFDHLQNGSIVNAVVRSTRGGTPKTLWVVRVEERRFEMGNVSIPVHDTSSRANPPGSDRPKEIHIEIESGLKAIGIERGA